MKTTDRKYLAALRKRYARASKKERGQMLDEYVRTTGCHRKHAIAVLRGKRSRTTGAIRRPRRSQYTAEDARALEKLSDLFDGINAKLLRVALDNELAHLYRGGFLQVSPACYRRLQQISPASIDRVRTRYGRGLPPRVKRAAPNRGRCSKVKSPFAPGPTGTKINPASPKWIWSRMMAAWNAAITRGR
jgi:hypothetical protein